MEPRPDLQVQLLGLLPRFPKGASPWPGDLGSSVLGPLPSVSARSGHQRRLRRRGPARSDEARAASGETSGAEGGRAVAGRRRATQEGARRGELCGRRLRLPGSWVPAGGDAHSEGTSLGALCSVWGAEGVSIQMPRRRTIASPAVRCDVSTMVLLRCYHRAFAAWTET